MENLTQLLDAIAATLPHERSALRRLKIQHAERSGGPLVRNEVLLERYRSEVREGLREANTAVESILQLNKIRSQSGIATLTVITKPYACPGRCVYCPTEARAPKSYLTNEPAVMRALRSDYDAYAQTSARLRALRETGHPTDKIELIIKGGTWSFYPERYQSAFIRDCVRAANDFPDGGIHPPPEIPLAAALEANETAPNRVIGITVETRPDYIDEDEIRRMRAAGVTRVELGVQSLNPEVLRRTVRDHGLEAVHAATRLLKDAGFKIAYHLMPNLPGADPEGDLETMRALFADARYQPDTLKLYPCVIIESAELFEWWRKGEYRPYDDETLIELLIGMKRLTPPYVRLERVIRDIPSPSIRGGCSVTNLRETVLARMRNRGLACRCIRCRQVRGEPAGDFKLIERRYPASGGEEIFLSFEDAASDRLASLLRLRFPGAEPLFPALRGASLVRELHSYGLHLPLHQRSEEAVQHQGYGKQLLARAEALSREAGMRRIAVIAGVGVREYYRRQGYRLLDTYMVKDLD